LASNSAGRYKIPERTDAILAAPRSPQLGQPPELTAAYAATVRSLTAVIAILNEQVASLQGQVEAHFGRPAHVAPGSSPARPTSILRLPSAEHSVRKTAWSLR
jgi:hypothetical protein